jgi:hypothetical protein
MYFCTNCDNMLYMKIEEIQDTSEGGGVESEETSDGIVKNKITYYCRCCNSVFPDLHKQESCVFSVNYNTENIKKKSFINKYMYDDITLPNAEGIKCPNPKCPSSKPNIKYIQYDKDNMKYIYVCMDCYENGHDNHIW